MIKHNDFVKTVLKVLHILRRAVIIPLPFLETVELQAINQTDSVMKVLFKSVLKS